eukprot:gene17791-24165_t
MLLQRVGNRAYVSFQDAFSCSAGNDNIEVLEALVKFSKGSYASNDTGILLEEALVSAVKYGKVPAMKLVLNEMKALGPPLLVADGAIRAFTHIESCDVEAVQTLLEATKGGQNKRSFFYKLGDALSTSVVLRNAGVARLPAGAISESPVTSAAKMNQLGEAIELVVHTGDVELAHVLLDFLEKNGDSIEFYLKDALAVAKHHNTDIATMIKRCIDKKRWTIYRVIDNCLFATTIAAFIVCIYVAVRSKH